MVRTTARLLAATAIATSFALATAAPADAAYVRPCSAGVGVAGEFLTHFTICVGD